MNRLLRLLSVRRTEVPRLSLAASIFFLVAVNDGIVKSVSAGVFNIRAGVERLPEMYTWIAWLFLLTMVLLSYLTTKVGRPKLLFGFLSCLALVLLINSLVLWYAHTNDLDLGGTGFYPFLFISSELVRNMANFQIWIVAGGICYTSRAKVLFPLLAASTTLGDIAGGFLVQLLGLLLDSYQIYALSVANMVVVIILMKPLVRRYFVAPSGSDGVEEETASLPDNLRYFLRSTYLKLLFLLSVAIFALYTAIHYAFNVVARQHFPSEGDITSFFGLFFGVAGVATLLFTTVALRHVLRLLGTGNVYSWVCGIHVVIALILLSAFNDVLPLSIIAAIFALNILNYVLLDSVIAPAYQVLIKLVPERNSDGTRMIMEGGFMLVGGLVGAGLTALHAQGFLSLSHFSTALVAISAVMVVAGLMLKRSYTEVLVRAVREQDFAVDDEQAMASMKEVIRRSPEFPRSLLLHSDDGVREMGIEILRQNASVAATICVPLVTHENPRIRSAALDALSGEASDRETTTHVLPLLDDEDVEVRLSAARYVGRMIEAAAENGQPEELDGEVRQSIIDAVAPRLLPDAETALLEAEFLFILDRLGDLGTTAARQIMLKDLLESDDVEEITAGIQTVTRMVDVGSNPEVFEHLDHSHPAVREAAVHAIEQLGQPDILEALLRTLGDPDPDVVEAAIAALGRKSAGSGQEQVIDALNSSSIKLWEGVIAALARQQSEQLLPQLLESCRQRLREANGYIVADSVVMQQWPGAASDLLADQLQLERRRVQDGVIRLLGQLGDVGVVLDLVERLGEESPAARENAIELLENIGDRSLMERLLPLLTGDADEALERAREISGLEQLSPDNALALCLKSGDTWTTMAAAWAAVSAGEGGLLADLDIEEDGPVGEIAAQATTTGGTAVADDQPLTSMEKITFLKESPFFAALPLEELYHIALSVQEESVREGTIVIKQGTLGDKMYIVVRGRMEVRVFGEGDSDGQQVAVTGEKQVLGDMALLDDEPRSASVIALEDSRLLSLQRGDLERILRRYSSIAFSMMRILSIRLRESQAA